MSQTPLPAPPTHLDLSNIQRDILGGLPKRTETCIFFKISDDVDAFRKHLFQLIPHITTVSQVQKDQNAIKEHRRQNQPGLFPLAGLNIAFSQAGLVKLGVTDDIKDSAFTAGQLADAPNLQDVPISWDLAFKRVIHGVILVTGDSHESVDKIIQHVEALFGVHLPHATILEVLRIRGDVRPGAEKGHEHFGFNDGISQPGVQGFDKQLNPGQVAVKPGVILVGEDGDSVTGRPTWAKDGSFLVFRRLAQLVPEFNQFLADNPIVLPGLSPEQGSELLGARLVGRWKSGAPVDITPLQDDPALGNDPTRNNNFSYAGEQDSETRCPFAAHTRKTNPRDDLEQLTPPTSVDPFRIIRRAIPYGPELSKGEIAEKKTIHDRGLLFICYQSNIENGFQFIQKNWANNPAFPPPPPNPPKAIQPGFDPIIGQAAGAAARTMSGDQPGSQASQLSLPIEFVISRGGEYFFTPSISALRNTLARHAR
ncbi:hypothetical protein JAAARDRAFT_57097 [Jaapia argillacea MUCL 33604]|uniref:Dyp-type peroxidase n=1 Tax=Jaapia argillacea MUCL 33604 TaxID=933084 RepID=A0A067PZ14_9AGAM|nr:hypothetical protein JAAARDRAFT_57097 [Jaapia argillacea MUCL 33604]